MRIILITMAILLLVTGFTTAQETPTLKAAQNVIRDQISAFIEGDNARAFSHAAPQIKQMFTTPEQFIAMVKKGYRPLFLPHSFRFTKNKLVNDNLFQELIVTAEDGKRWRAGYSMKLGSDGTWNITGVILQALAGKGI